MLEKEKGEVKTYTPLHRNNIFINQYSHQILSIHFTGVWLVGRVRVRASSNPNPRWGGGCLTCGVFNGEDLCGLAGVTDAGLVLSADLELDLGPLDDVRHSVLAVGSGRLAALDPARSQLLLLLQGIPAGQEEQHRHSATCSSQGTLTPFFCSQCNKINHSAIFI